MRYLIRLKTGNSHELQSVSADMMTELRRAYPKVRPGLPVYVDESGDKAPRFFPLPSPEFEVEKL